MKENRPLLLKKGKQGNTLYLSRACFLVILRFLLKADLQIRLHDLDAFFKAELCAV